MKLSSARLRKLQSASPKGVSTLEKLLDYESWTPVAKEEGVTRLAIQQRVVGAMRKLRIEADHPSAWYLEDILNNKQYWLCRIAEYKVAQRMLKKNPDSTDYSEYDAELGLWFDRVKRLLHSPELRINSPKLIWADPFGAFDSGWSPEKFVLYLISEGDEVIDEDDLN